MARASSGSRSCASSVEPLMSANSAVTVLRSPSRFSGGDVSAIRICGSFDFLAAADWDVPSAAPHSPQNFSRDSFVAPHRGHLEASVSPHSAQNFRPSRLSVPHFEQRIGPTLIRQHRRLWWRLSSPAPEPDSVLPEDAEVVMHDLDLTSVWISQEQPLADGGVLDWSS